MNKNGNQRALLTAALALGTLAILGSGFYFYQKNDTGSSWFSPTSQTKETVEIESIDPKEAEIPKKTEYALNDFIEEIAAGKTPSKDFQLETPTISNKVQLSAMSPILLELRESGSDIPEKILTAKSYDLSGLWLDSRIVLEGYIYQQYKNRGEYDPKKLAAMPIGSEGYLQLILKEIYSNHPEDFKKFADPLIKRHLAESSRRYNLIVKMLEYGKSDGKFDFMDPTYALNNQVHFFLKWNGWNDLTDEERKVLFKGQQIFQRYATLRESDFKKDIDKEISEFETYLTEYEAAKLHTFWPASFYLPYMLANLYAIKGDFDAGIAIADKKIAAIQLTPRKEKALVFQKEFNVIDARMGFLHHKKADALLSQGKKAEALESYKKAEALMKNDLLVMPFTTPDVFVVWLDLKKKIASLSS